MATQDIYYSLNRNTFSTLTEAWHRLGEVLTVEGAPLESRNGGSREVCDVSFTIAHPKNNFLLSPIRKADPVYAAAELLWYLSGESDIKMIAAYAPQWKKYAEEADPRVWKANGAYGARWGIASAGDSNQINNVTRLLMEHPNTRRAVISMWRPIDLRSSVLECFKDIPCTICLQFHLRGGILSCSTYMRSNDFWLGLPYDVFAFTALQQFIAASLGVGVGVYTHTVGSLHVYDKHAEQVVEAYRRYLDEPANREDHADYTASSGNFLLEASVCLDMEAAYRIARPNDREMLDPSAAPATLLGDCVRLCSTKFSGRWRRATEDCVHPLLVQGMKIKNDVKAGGEF